MSELSGRAQVLRRRVRLLGPGPRRALVWGVWLLAVSSIAVLLLAGPAQADPVPPAPGVSEDLVPSPTTPPPSADKDIEDLKDDVADAAKEKEKKERQEKRNVAAEREERFEDLVEEYRKGHKSGVLSPFSTTDQWGVPADAYQAAVDGGSVTEVEQTFWAMATRGLFSYTKWLVLISCWLIAFALSWSLYGILAKPALVVSDALYSQTLVQLGVPSLLLAFSGVVACWHIFFGSRSRGWGELVAGTLISALAVSTFAAPPKMLLSEDDGVVAQTQKLSLAVAGVILSPETTAKNSNAETEELLRPVTDKLVNAFIVQPAALLTYDQTFTGECRQKFSESRVRQAVVNERLETGKKEALDIWHKLSLTKKPEIQTTVEDWGLSKGMDFVRDQVGPVEPDKEFEKQCVDGDGASVKEADENRALAALFIFIAALLVFVLVVVLCFGLLSAEAMLALEAMILRAALVVGIMPGPGRAWLWDRLLSIAKLLLAVMAVAIGLAIFILMATAVLGADKEDIPGPLAIRFIVLDLLCVAMFVFRKRIASKGKAWANEARTRAGNSRFGGRQPSAPIQQPKKSKVAALAGTALLVGAMAASGGGSGGAGGTMMVGRRGGQLAGARLGAQGLRRGLRLGRRAAAGGARAGEAAGRFGLRYTAGLPVHGPRAVRTATARRAERAATRAARPPLRERLHDAVVPQPGTPQRQFADEYWNNIGGRATVNHIREARNGAPPVPSPYGPRTGDPPQHTRPAGAPVASSPGAQPATSSRRRTSATSPSPATPAASSSRARGAAAPPYSTAPPATAQQAALRARLHRARTGGRRGAPPASPGPGGSGGRR